MSHRSLKMPEKVSYFFPQFLIIVLSIIGALFGLAIGGHFEENGTLKHNKKQFCITLLFAISFSISGGAFIIEHWGFAHYSQSAKGLIHLLTAVFGVLIIGIGYRSIQLTFTDKTLPEIIAEIKNIVKSWTK